MVKVTIQDVEGLKKDLEDILRLSEKPKSQLIDTKFCSGVRVGIALLEGFLHARKAQREEVAA
nr:hypothetical protein 10 [bacterium]